jgi:phosphoserine phosphatase RsbU/P
VIMGRMRSALRAYALETADPADILTRLDRKMQHFEPEALATILCAVFEPGLARMHVSLAGHPPPVVAPPGEPAYLAEVAPDLMIGVSPSAPRRTASVDLPPGAVLCFYTDGLVERRGEPIDAGLTRLCRVVTAEPPDAVCASVMLELVGSESARDDIALLVIRCRPR